MEASQAQESKEREGSLQKTIARLSTELSQTQTCLHQVTQDLESLQAESIAKSLHFLKAQAELGTLTTAQQGWLTQKEDLEQRMRDMSSEHAHELELATKDTQISQDLAQQLQLDLSEVRDKQVKCQ
jgi:acetyl/propionyl-CoA carboxylase alpha subunit